MNMRIERVRQVAREEVGYWRGMWEGAWGRVEGLEEGGRELRGVLVEI
jgi:hypothetical protein